jgi:hypothetical protein
MPLEAVATTKRDKAAALKLLKRIMKKYWTARSLVTDGLRAYSAAMTEIGVADRHEVGGGEFAPAVSTTRTGDAAVSNSEDATEVQLSSCPGAQPIQSGAASRNEASLQRETLCCFSRVACCRGIDRPRKMAVAVHVESLRYFDTGDL